MLTTKGRARKARKVRMTLCCLTSPVNGRHLPSRDDRSLIAACAQYAAFTTSLTLLGKAARNLTLIPPIRPSPARLPTMTKNQSAGRTDRTLIGTDKTVILTLPGGRGNEEDRVRTPTKRYQSQMQNMPMRTNSSLHLVAAAYVHTFRVSLSPPDVWKLLELLLLWHGRLCRPSGVNSRVWSSCYTYSLA